MYAKRLIEGRLDVLKRNKEFVLGRIEELKEEISNFGKSLKEIENEKQELKKHFQQ
ncbi:hypothetical protein [Bacillus toyonensis]|uniref:hypothetical protein n=1 Tax=Bacillus toyonensis TaxID=155322 RepID=UPI00159BD5C7|nr:hypothetical protein [Bacillus toyonensis]